MPRYNRYKINKPAQRLRKLCITVLGSILCLLGLALLILPGPAWLLLPIGLAILSLEHVWARKWLKQSQGYLRQSAYYMDQRVAQFRHWRYRRKQHSR